jgi:hypothetical protein
MTLRQNRCFSYVTGGPANSSEAGDATAAPSGKCCSKGPFLQDFPASPMCRYRIATALLFLIGMEPIEAFAGEPLLAAHPSA